MIIEDIVHLLNIEPVSPSRWRFEVGSLVKARPSGALGLILALDGDKYIARIAWVGP